MTTKTPKQLNAEIAQILARTGAEPYWPGGFGGGGSPRGGGSRSAVVRPHPRTRPTCTRCSQFHTTEEHARHLGAGGSVKKVRPAKKARPAKAKRVKASKKTRASKKKARVAKVKAKKTTRATKMKAKPRARRRPAIAPRPMAPVSARPSSAIAPPPMSDAELADQIKSTIRKIGPGGRFGWKVFISEIWRRMMPDLTREGMTLSAFKQRLLRLNREGRIVLARADLVGAMDPTKVAESEIQDRGSTFHFVLDPESTPGY